MAKTTVSLCIHVHRPYTIHTHVCTEITKRTSHSCYLYWPCEINRQKYFTPVRFPFLFRSLFLFLFVGMVKCVCVCVHLLCRPLEMLVLFRPKRRWLCSKNEQLDVSQHKQYQIHIQFYVHRRPLLAILKAAHFRFMNGRWIFSRAFLFLIFMSPFCLIELMNKD